MTYPCNLRQRHSEAVTETCVMASLDSQQADQAAYLKRSASASSLLRHCDAPSSFRECQTLAASSCRSKAWPRLPTPQIAPEIGAQKLPCVCRCAQPHFWNEPQRVRTRRQAETCGKKHHETTHLAALELTSSKWADSPDDCAPKRNTLKETRLNGRFCNSQILAISRKNLQAKLRN